MKADFSGYASVAGLKCADGHTILAHAFKDHDGHKVPLMWQHLHDDPAMVIGHAIVEDRPDGTYVYGYLNDSPKAQSAKHGLRHGDIDSMSIFANRLVKRGMEVVHGVLREVSLVLAGANPGAKIEHISIQHNNGTIQEAIDEAIVYTGLTLEHADASEEGDDMADESGETLADIYNTMDEKQKNLVHFIAGSNISNLSVTQSDTDEDDEEDDEEDEDKVPAPKSKEKSDDKPADSDESKAATKTDDSDEESGDKSDDDDEDDEKKLQHGASTTQENNMTHRVFDKHIDEQANKATSHLSHDQLKTIADDALEMGSLKKSFLAHAGTFGIDNIDILFPDAKALSNTPEFLSRRMEWVSDVLGSTRHVPYSRIKSVVADITPETARARGYIKGSMKKEEVFGLLQRTTTPTTIYKKQKLDRDDIIDITDIDVVAWLKAEMRLMLDEEIARAILLGDGRPALVGGEANPDKVKDPMGATEGSGIRSVANDHELYAEQVQLPSGLSTESRIDELVRFRGKYRGSGQPVLYTTTSFITDILLHKDKVGRRVYENIADVASAFMVSKIVEVEPMEDHQDIVGIFVNLRDYSVGTDKGGQIAFFDDFDIDYNQNKYLTETRSSGALTKIKSAVVVRRALGTIVTPTAPSFDGETNKVTIPSVTGVTYKINDEVKTAGDHVITEDVIVEAVPAEGYDFKTGITDSWVFTYTDSE